MTDEQLKTIIDDMLQFFGKLPDPSHQPIQFTYYVKMWKYYKQNKH